MLNNFYVYGPTSMKLVPHLGALKKWYMHGSELMNHVFRNQDQGPITHGLKSLGRFYDAMLPCSTLVLSGKDEFKIFQHCVFLF